jgi:N-methylhydantoinase A/oxoprolinase/acetone carboxylase beta subunit
VRRLDALDPDALTAMFDEMAAQATAVVRDSGPASTVSIARSVDARYVGQGYELTVPVPAGPLDAAALARIRSAFDEIYALRYGYANPTEPVETVTWKLAAISGAPRVALAKAASDARDCGLKGRRRAWFPETRGWTDCDVYDRYALAPGARLSGPAIVEERESTSVLPPGVSAAVDEYANLIVEVAP